MSSPSPSSPPYPGAIPPPPGVTPNLNAPNENRAAVIAALVIIIAVPSILMTLRLYVKAFLLKEFRVSDALGTLAWLLGVAMSGVAFGLLDDGMGIHAWDITPEGFSAFVELNNTHQVVYVAAILSAKVAILLQLADIFVIARQRNARWWTIHGLILLNVIFLGSVFFIIIFECNPREKIWMPMLPGTCINEQDVFVASSVINVLDDFIILILPVFWVSRLQLNLGKKLAIASVFAAGLFACITSIVRLIKSVQTFGSMDITYLFLPVGLWATAEVGSAVAVFALPPLPRLFRRQAAATSTGSTYGNTALSRDPAHKSRNAYVEMDDEVLLNRVPPSQSPSHPPSHSEVKGEGLYALSDDTLVPNANTPRIFRTVSVNQTSEAI